MSNRYKFVEFETPGITGAKLICQMGSMAA